MAKKPTRHNNADFRDNKRGIHSVYPERAIDSASGTERVEPLLTPSVFKERFLFGIPLVSPVTEDKLTNRHLKDYIKRGVNQFELDSQVDVMQVVRRHKVPFDPATYYQYIFIEIPHKPIRSVNKLAIMSAVVGAEDLSPYGFQQISATDDFYPEGSEIYRIPSDWIEMGNALRGQLNVIPLNPAFSAVSYSQAASGSGAALLTFLGSKGWIPSFWVVECVHGFCSDDGEVPVVVNEAIGAQAAIMVLDNLIPQYRITSSSLSIDGLGQSVGDQMYGLLQDKRKELQARYDALVRRFKTMTSSKMFSGHV